MIIIQCEQGSPEWIAARLGRVTASRVADVVSKTKSGWGAGRANYAAQLISERLTGTAAESFVSAAMKHGTDTEPAARTMYEFMHDAAVDLVGVVRHPSIEMSSASPDGLVASDGLLQIKCPNTATHIETLLGAPIDGRYVKRMQWEMACTGRAWCDFVSFDPRMPVEMQLAVQRVPRDASLIAELDREVRAFLTEVEATLARLTSLYRKPELEAAA